MRNNKEIVEFENLFLQNQWIDFNQTWHKVFLGGGGGVKCAQTNGYALFQGEIITK